MYKEDKSQNANIHDIECTRHCLTNIFYGIVLKERRIFKGWFNDLCPTLLKNFIVRQKNWQWWRREGSNASLEQKYHQLSCAQKKTIKKNSTIRSHPFAFIHLFPSFSSWLCHHRSLISGEKTIKTYNSKKMFQREGNFEGRQQWNMKELDSSNTGCTKKNLTTFFIFFSLSFYQWNKATSKCLLSMKIQSSYIRETSDDNHVRNDNLLQRRQRALKSLALSFTDCKSAWERKIFKEASGKTSGMILRVNRGHHYCFELVYLHSRFWQQQQMKICIIA